MVKLLLVKLKNLYVCFNHEKKKKKKNGNQNVKVEKMAVFVKIYDHYHHKFNFGKLWNFAKEFETEI